MTLKEYLQANGLKPEDFAKTVEASEAAVKKWLRGDRLPRPDQMRVITDKTGGAVQPNDFYALPKQAEPSAEAAA